MLWGWHGLLAKIYNKPLYIYANSIGPLKGKISKFITRYVLNKANIITVRDTASANLIKEINVKVRPQITTDPAFALNISNIKKNRLSNI